MIKPFQIMEKPMFFLILFVFIGLAGLVNAQSVVTGVVTDKLDQSPLIGVNILIDGTSSGTVTDVDGKFSIEVPENGILIISFVGYETQEITVGGRSIIDIAMVEDATSLEELVVTGYTIQDKKDLTGAVAPVEMNRIVSFPVSGVENMLQGQVPGVIVVSDNSPGGSSAVRVRGFSTIRNNDPLYIIDGVPTSAGLNLINPADIESLQVLKDASSSSIYGSRAANGVVIITTKKGKVGKTSISFDAYAGMQNATNLPKMLNAQQYGDLLWEANLNDGKTPSSDVYGDGPTAVIPQWLDADQTIPSDDVDWVNEIFEAASVQNYNLNLSSGNEVSRHYLSLGIFRPTGSYKTHRIQKGVCQAKYRL
jgi:TonB-linked SusC/RagA family outer membrane protein